MERFLVWMCGWAKLYDGLVEIFTLGHVRGVQSLQMAKCLARWRWKYLGKVTP